MQGDIYSWPDWEFESEDENGEVRLTKEEGEECWQEDGLVSDDDRRGVIEDIEAQVLYPITVFVDGELMPNCYLSD